VYTHPNTQIKKHTKTECPTKASQICVVIEWLILNTKSRTKQVEILAVT